MLVLARIPHTNNNTNTLRGSHQRRDGLRALALLTVALALHGVPTKASAAEHWASVDPATGTGVYVWDDGRRYEGQTVNGMRQGHGVLTLTDQTRIEGEFKNNQLLSGTVFYNNGSKAEINFQTRQGTLTRPNGSRFEGQFFSTVPVKGQFTMPDGKVINLDMLAVYNKITGHGQQVAENGSSYEGDYVHGNLEGQGTFTSPSGAVYTGEFKNGKYNGHGLFKQGDGMVYDCEWVDNKQQGQGKLQFANGDQFEGSFYEGKMLKGLMHLKDGTERKLDLEIVVFKKSGPGEIWMRDGMYVSGNFQDGLLEGIGKMSTVQGYEFEGQWHAGRLLHGRRTSPEKLIFEGDFNEAGSPAQGSYKWPDGSHYEGAIANEKFNGVGQYTNANGAIQAGNFIDGKLNGRGSFSTAEGYYEGNFVNTEFSGSGTYTWIDGTRYTGEWAHNKLNGYGTMTWASGDHYTGNFVNGERQGRTAFEISNAQQQAQAQAEQQNSSSGSWFFKVAVLATTAGLINSSAITSAQKLQTFSATAQDVLSDGQTHATANLMQAQVQGRNAGSTNTAGNANAAANTAAQCGLNNYHGPNDDPQTATFCKEAYAYACVGDLGHARQICSLLNSTLQGMGDKQSATQYCSAYCH